MADWARGLQSGFQTGMQIGEALERRKEREAYAEAMKATPTQQYTPEQAQQLEAMAAAGINPQTGKPYYEIAATPGGLNYQVTPQFDYAGSTGAPISVGPGYELLGRTFAQAPTENQITSARMNRMADVAAQFGNPMEAQRMRLAASQEDRAQAAEQRQQGLYGFQEADLRRKQDVQTIQDRIAQMPQGDLDTLAAKLNTNQSQLPMLFTGKTKDGYTFLTMDANGQPREPITYSAAQVRRLAAANALFEAGFGGEGLAELDRVDKSLADRIGARNAVVQAVGTSAQGAERLGQGDRALALKADAMGAAQGDRSLGNLIALARLDSSRVSDIETMLKDPAIPKAQKDALIRERNDLNKGLKGLTAQIRSTLMPSSGEPAPAAATPTAAPAPKSGDTIEVNGVSMRFKGGDPMDRKNYEMVTPKGARSGNSFFPSRAGQGLAKPTASQEQIDAMSLAELQEYNRSGTIPQRLLK